ncbi:sulfite exporter TauE/SafE family protein [Vibrio gallicus]|uniref:sulfite exporter TauE/SafE family protein n=1 Tax=Vibrio gallicus TaxID=190897 RepID=UPI0021C2F917|nr:sulfite exporter TauE/SafE family protein [Vibrio gallicus]
MGLIFLGAFVQTSIGFGLAIVSAPLLFQISVDYVPGPIVLVALFISMLSSFKHRSNIAIGGLKLAVYGRIPGSILGGAILLYVSPATISFTLGIFVLIAVVISLLPFRIEPTPRRMFSAGFLAGFMGTSSSIGGPPMALLLQHQEANNLRANLSAFFVFSSIISLIVLMFIGAMSYKHLLLSLPLIPAAFFGYWSATKLMPYIPRVWMHRTSLLMCSVSGVTAILHSVHF